MRIKNIDHIVITTSDLKSCLNFYVGILGMEHRETNGHHNLYFPNGKISIHTRKGEFQPAAENPTYGSQDFCLIVDGDLKDKKQNLKPSMRQLSAILLSVMAHTGQCRAFILETRTEILWN